MIGDVTFSSMAYHAPSAAPRRGGFATVLAAGLSGIAIAALGLSGHGALLRIAIPAFATLVGLVLYLSHPVRYLEYSLWVWFLAPLVRRLVDWRFGYTEPNMVLLAPVLVTALAGLSLVRPSSRANARIPPVFVFCGLAILYGFVVGMLLKPSAETVYGLFNWMAPMLLGLHVYLNWPHYEEHRKAITRTFLWGVLVLGLYGIYQYFAAPAWDMYWLSSMQHQGSNSAVGLPLPGMFRVWSTLNFPGAFANVMMVGLLMLLSARSLWRIPAAAVGYASFALSLVRTAWLSWAVGILLVVTRIRSRALVRGLLCAVLAVICAVPFLGSSYVGPMLEDRVSTFRDLGHDDSFGSRAEMYGALMTEAGSNPVGYGLSNETTSHGIPIDSGIISMLFSLGWLGTLLFSAGILHLLLGHRSSGAEADDFAVVDQSIMIAILAQLVGGEIFVGVNGAIFWMLAAMTLGRVHAFDAAMALKSLPKNSASEAAYAFAASAE